ncbi:MAG TPA: response regulator transcription factor [Candidatus Acidoferrales bacterium]|jgi:DNA-binding NarL/FixJ family response regulator|nr:response regulator transcription factor [Candidatus Acidoferrales bacterium]
MNTVAIVEDNTVMRNSFRQWIDAAPGFRCVFACATAEEALAEIPRLKPDVVLMDVHLPGESGIACTAQLKEKLPGVQIIIVTVYRDHEMIFQALQAGACGYLLKRSSPEELLKAISEVLSGGAPMTGEIARLLVEAFQKKPAAQVSGDGLTQREYEILALLSEGLSNKEIADRVKISYDTVRAHLRHIYEKLHVRGRTEAVRKYLKSSPPAATGPSQ